jgi:hypothetical protein
MCIHYVLLSGMDGVYDDLGRCVYEQQSNVLSYQHPADVDSLKNLDAFPITCPSILHCTLPVSLSVLFNC